MGDNRSLRILGLLLLLRRLRRLLRLLRRLLARKAKDLNSLAKPIRDMSQHAERDTIIFINSAMQTIQETLQ